MTKSYWIAAALGSSSMIINILLGDHPGMSVNSAIFPGALVGGIAGIVVLYFYDLLKSHWRVGGWARWALLALTLWPLVVHGLISATR